MKVFFITLGPEIRNHSYLDLRQKVVFAVSMGSDSGSMPECGARCESLGSRSLLKCAFRVSADLATCINMSRVLRKQDFCLSKIKGADQLRGNSKADQRLCFRYLDSTIPLLPKSKISSF